MNLSKRTKVEYVDAKSLNKKIVKPRYKHHSPVYSNLESAEQSIYEVHSGHKSIRDSIPVHVAFYILSGAKQHVLLFMHKLLTELDCSGLRLLYMGKGSTHFLCLSYSSSATICRFVGLELLKLSVQVKVWMLIKQLLADKVLFVIMAFVMITFNEVSILVVLVVFS